MAAVSDVIGSFKRALVPIHPAGRPHILTFAVITLALLYFSWPLGFLGLLGTGWCTYFFRDPPRVTPLREGLVVSPADGTVIAVDRATAPAELGLGEAPRTRIGVFMSVFDVHINRAPLSGRVERVSHRSGKFFNADLDLASLENERVSVLLDTAHGPVGVVLIAGYVARRIVPFVGEAQQVSVGERIGLIRFGSRVDIYLPVHCRPLVGIGSKAIAGETFLADLNAAPGELSFRVS
jgi:phosphatidylserine decarboxylase